MYHHLIRPCERRVLFVITHGLLECKWSNLVFIHDQPLVDCVCWVAHTMSLAFQEQHLEFKNSMGPGVLASWCIGLILFSPLPSGSHGGGGGGDGGGGGLFYVEASSKVRLVCHEMQVHVRTWLIDEGWKLEDVWMIKEDESWKMFGWLRRMKVGRCLDD